MKKFFAAILAATMILSTASISVCGKDEQDNFSSKRAKTLKEKEIEMMMDGTNSSSTSESDYKENINANGEFEFKRPDKSSSKSSQPSKKTPSANSKPTSSKEEKKKADHVWSVWNTDGYTAGSDFATKTITDPITGKVTVEEWQFTYETATFKNITGVPQPQRVGRPTIIGFGSTEDDGIFKAQDKPRTADGVLLDDQGRDPRTVKKWTADDGTDATDWHFDNRTGSIKYMCRSGVYIDGKRLFTWDSEGNPVFPGGSDKRSHGVTFS